MKDNKKIIQELKQDIKYLKRDIRTNNALFENAAINLRKYGDCIMDELCKIYDDPVERKKTLKLMKKEFGPLMKSIEEGLKE